MGWCKKGWWREHVKGYFPPEKSIDSDIELYRIASIFFNHELEAREASLLVIEKNGPPTLFKLNKG